MIEKQILRSQIKKTLTSEFLLHNSVKKTINELLIGKKVCTYMPLKNEIDINNCFDNVKELFTTYVNQNGVSITTLKKPFEINKYGVLQPLINTNEKTIDIFIVPGVAFDITGNRLGRGVGFYDKLLAKFPNSIKIGIAHESNILDTIPFEAHDVKMNKIVTSSKIYDIEI